MEDRIEFNSLIRTPFLDEQLSDFNLHRLDQASFYRELTISEPKMEGGHTSLKSYSNSLVDCLDDFQATERDLVLTARPSHMREILVKQLSECPDLAHFDYKASPYFRKYNQVLKMSFGGAYGIEEETRCHRAMTELAAYDD